MGAWRRSQRLIEVWEEFRGGALYVAIILKEDCDFTDRTDNPGREQELLGLETEITGSNFGKVKNVSI